jgi:Family of unknown function (DUF6152)
MIKVKVNTFGLGAIIAGALTIPAVAHHAFARFDTTRRVTLQGVVQTFQWTNPHAWVLLRVDEQGRVEQWAIEMAGFDNLIRQGYEPRMIVAGMQVTVTIHPLRDGTSGGQLVKMTLPDGTVMGRDAAGMDP